MSLDHLAAAGSRGAHLRASWLALFGHSSTERASDSSTPTRMPPTLVAVGKINSASTGALWSLLVAAEGACSSALRRVLILADDLAGVADAQQQHSRGHLHSAAQWSCRAQQRAHKHGCSPEWGLPL